MTRPAVWTLSLVSAAGIPVKGDTNNDDLRKLACRLVENQVLGLRKQAELEG
jgi:hypothetical protein